MAESHADGLIELENVVEFPLGDFRIPHGDAGYHRSCSHAATGETGDGLFALDICTLERVPSHPHISGTYSQGSQGERCPFRDTMFAFAP